MEKIVKPIKAISFEAALRNLASRLTGTPVAELPRTQEAIVQYMAENVESMGANLAVTEPPAAAQDGVEGAGGTSTPPAAETPQEAPKTPAKAAPKTGGGRKPKAKAET